MELKNLISEFKECKNKIKELPNYIICIFNHENKGFIGYNIKSIKNNIVDLVVIKYDITGFFETKEKRVNLKDLLKINNTITNNLEDIKKKLSIIYRQTPKKNEYSKKIPMIIFDIISAKSKLNFNEIKIYIEKYFKIKEELPNYFKKPIYSLSDDGLILYFIKSIENEGFTATVVTYTGDSIKKENEDIIPFEDFKEISKNEAEDFIYYLYDELEEKNFDKNILENNLEAILKLIK